MNTKTEYPPNIHLMNHPIALALQTVTGCSFFVFLLIWKRLDDAGTYS